MRIALEVPRSVRRPPVARRGGPAALIAACVLLSACGGGPDLAAARAAVRRGAAPLSFLVITLDTTRADHLRCYGYGGVETPAIDRVAERGVLFEQAIASVPLTVPSHCSIFTGAFPPGHGVRTNEGTLLDGPNLTLAEILARRGYATAAFVGAAVLERHCGLAQGFERYDDDFSGAGRSGGLAYPERPAGAVVRAASRWLEGHAGDGPFLLWVHLFDPHRPFAPPAPFRRDYRSSPYDGEIAYADAAIGKLLAALEAGPAAGDTLVAFLSDHGEGLGEHGESSHGVFLYDSTLHVPLVLRCPKILPAGIRVPSQVRLVDLVPTLLDLLGIDPPAGIQGASLLPLVDGSTGSGPNAGLREAYAESYYGYEVFGWSPLVALRTGRRKLIRAPRPELYDLVSDPGERRNLFTERGGEARRLSSRLEEWRGELARVGVSGPREIDPRTRAMLRRLGYLTSSGGGIRPPAPPRMARNLPDPKDRRALLAGMQRAATLVAGGRHEEALEILEDLGRKAPGSTPILELTGEAFIKLGRYRRALEVYRRLVERDPADDDALVNLGSIYRALEEPDKARPWLERAVKANPRNSDALLGLGDLQMQGAPNPKGARECYERFLEVAPADPEAPRVRLLLERLGGERRAKETRTKGE